MRHFDPKDTLTGRATICLYPSPGSLRPNRQSCQLTSEKVKAPLAIIAMEPHPVLDAARSERLPSGVDVAQSPE